MNPSTTPWLYKLERDLSDAQVVDELEAMPMRLRRAVSGFGVEELGRKPGPDDWSAFETVTHLRDASLVYAIRFRFIVMEEEPFLPNYDEDKWAAECLDRVEDMPAILGEIAASRSDLVRLLRRIPDAAWRRAGRHEVAGRLVLDDYARHQVVHEEMHLAQLMAAAGSH